MSAKSSNGSITVGDRFDSLRIGHKVKLESGSGGKTFTGTIVDKHDENHEIIVCNHSKKEVFGEGTRLK
ncbi:MAG: hypothetical protein WCX88_04015 [Patescibacteria group bacterium]